MTDIITGPGVIRYTDIHIPGETITETLARIKIPPLNKLLVQEDALEDAKDAYEDFLAAVDRVQLAKEKIDDKLGYLSHSQMTKFGMWRRRVIRGRAGINDSRRSDM